MSESSSDSTVCEATIEALSTDGRGIARVDGTAVFVASGLPGDRLQLRINSTTRPASAEIVERISLSPLRAPHPCPHADRCVGSPWGSLAYEEQLLHKRELVERTLHKMLGDVSVEPVVPSSDVWHYRNRVALHVWRNSNRMEIGFRSSVRQAAGVTINTCSLAEEAVTVGIHALTERLSAVAMEQLPALPSRIQVHRTQRGVGALLIFNGECRPSVVELWKEILTPNVLPGGLWFASGTRAGIVRHNSPILASTGTLPLRTMSLGHEIDVHPAAFCQANSKAAALVERGIRRWTNEHAFHRVWDIYGGFGALGLAAADSSIPVEIFEISPLSESTLRELAKHVGNRDTRFHRGDLLRTLPRHVNRITTDDLIILDPPRSGAHADVLRLIGESPARTVAYLSCNPARLARDILLLKPYRFRPLLVRPYDFFPQTPAIEVLAILTR